MRVLVVEQASQLAEIGAGLQLGPNAMKALERLGVLPRLMPSLMFPSRLVVRHGLSGTRLADFALQPLRTRHGAPHALAHRADLLAALFASARDHPDIEIVTGERIVSVERFERPLARTESGQTVEAEAVVGADGMRSAVRSCLLGREADPRALETIERALVEAERLPQISPEAIALWLMPGGHVVHYPLRAGRVLNVVAVWGAGRSGEDAGQPRLDGLCAELAAILSTPATWRRWPAVDRDPAPVWGREATTLIGDAAHPSLPYLAQGAAMALEDAVTLGAASRGGRSPEEAFRAYEAARRPRTARMTREARRQGWVDHLGPPLSLARDLVMRVLPQGAFLRRLDWIYGWRPPSEEA